MSERRELHDLLANGTPTELEMARAAALIEALRRSRVHRVVRRVRARRRVPRPRYRRPRLRGAGRAGGAGSTSWWSASRDRRCGPPPRRRCRARPGPRTRSSRCQDPAGWWKGELETNVTMDAEDLFLRELPRDPHPGGHAARRRTGSAPSSAPTAPGRRSTKARPTSRRPSRPTPRCASPGIPSTPTTCRRPRRSCATRAASNAPASSPGSGSRSSANGTGRCSPRCRRRSSSSRRGAR